VLQRLARRRLERRAPSRTTSSSSSLGQPFGRQTGSAGAWNCGFKCFSGWTSRPSGPPAFPLPARRCSGQPMTCPASAPLKIEKSAPWSAAPFVGTVTDFSRLHSDGLIVITIKRGRARRPCVVQAALDRARHLRRQHPSRDELGALEAMGASKIDFVFPDLLAKVGLAPTSHAGR
jgi:hypothetical protein